MDWNKDSVADANFAKIDLLSLPVLDQIEEALDMVEEREGRRLRPEQARPRRPRRVRHDQRGPVQGPSSCCSRPRNSRWASVCAHATCSTSPTRSPLIRPGVGVQGSAVSQFVERYRHGVPWDYDHPLERRALERGYGIIVWQEQVVQLLMDVAGMTAAEADEVRRAFARPNNEHLIAMHWERFREGAVKNESRRRRPGRYSPRSTATTCSPNPTPTPSASPRTRRHG